MGQFRTVQFRVDHEPVPQPRQRHRIVKSRGFVQNYTPSNHPVHSFKSAVRAAGEAAMGGVMLQGPIVLTATFVLPRPSNMVWKRRDMPRVPHTKRCDWDNLGKSLTDAMTGVCYEDDGQLFMVNVEKWIAAGNEQPHVVVTMQEAVF